MLKNNSGITLVSLMVTVIILLILTGVSLKTALGHNGLIEKTTEIVEESKKATIGDEVKLEVLAAQMELITSSSGGDISDYSNLITNNVDYYTYTNDNKKVNFTLDESGSVILNSIVIGNTTKE